VKAPPSILVTFGDGDLRYKRAAVRLVEEATSIGLYERTFRFDLQDVKSIDPENYARIHSWLSIGDVKGIGYWTWKRPIIQFIAQQYPSHLIHYLDAGHVVLQDSVAFSRIRQWLIEAKDEGGLAWSLQQHLEIEWTKRETLELLDSTSHWRYTPQIEGGFVLLPGRTALEYCAELKKIHKIKDGFHLTGETQLSAYPEFKAHRHDQSIHSLLWKNLGLHSRSTETSFPGNCRAMIAARHASGFSWGGSDQLLLRKIEFYAGKIEKGLKIIKGRSLQRARSQFRDFRRER
jgi:hypothetical protein